MRERSGKKQSNFHDLMGPPLDGYSGVVAQHSAVRELARPGLYAGVPSPPSDGLIAFPAFRVSAQSLRLYRSERSFMSGNACASQRDLAWFYLARGELPLFGGPRLLALGISGLPRRDRKQTSRNYLSDAHAVVSSIARKVIRPPPASN